MDQFFKKDRNIIDKLPSSIELELTDYIKFLYKIKWKLCEFRLNRDGNEMTLDFESNNQTLKNRYIRITIRTTENKKPFEIIENWIYDKYDPAQKGCWAGGDIEWSIYPSELDENLNKYVKFYYVEYGKIHYDEHIKNRETLYTIQ